MTPEQIREAACAAFDASMEWASIKASGQSEWMLRAIDSVYRAGMAAGRAEAKQKRAKKDPTVGDNAVTVNVAEMVRHGVCPLAAEDWLRVRRQHKAPLTRTAWSATLREAEEAGMHIGAVVQMCAERSWRGFKAEYVAKSAPSGPGRGPRIGRVDRQLETAALMTGGKMPEPTDMGEVYDVGQQRLTGR